LKPEKKKDFILKVGTIIVTNPSTMTLITQRNIPKEIKFIGKKRIFKRGFIKILTKAKTKEARIKISVFPE